MERALSSPGSAPAAPPSGVAADAPTPPRVAVVGVSVHSPCGVRDHATLLAEALAREGVSCSLHWHTRQQLTLRAALREMRAWSRELAAELERLRPDAVLLHYSAFSYSYRGVPVFLHPVLAALRRARVPTLSIMHELAYPWGRSGWRGVLWGVTQRACLIELVRASRAVLVTADFQERWLQTRAWLPERPLGVAPVFSNLPAPREQPGGGGRVVGVFGYAYQSAAMPLVLDALQLLSRQVSEVRLALLGAPGRASQAAEELLLQARARGVRERLSFAGPLPAQELSDALARCDVLVFPDQGGPSSRKGTLAGALASGTPVVALDGPRNWPELLDAEALELVAHDPRALASALEGLLADAERRRDLGARGHAFAQTRMGLLQTAHAVIALLEELPLARSASEAPAGG
jgi:glycosyltransferase involved in cell wall biosynthesis